MGVVVRQQTLGLAAVLCATLVIAGCAAGPRPGAGGIYQTGQATYYADKFRGRRTANGERYRPSRLTAAHRALPFGSRVRVTNQNNGRSVTVRINDRGPYVGGRIIDLSSKAARRLRMKRAGVVPVTLEIISAD